MKKLLLFPITSIIALSFASISEAAMVTLLSGGGFAAGTIDGGFQGNLLNSTQDIAFTSAMPEGKTSLALLEAGDVLTLSFDMSFTAASDGISTGKGLSVGFLSGAPDGTTGHNVYFALIRPRDVEPSAFRTRTASVYGGGTGGTNAVLGDTFSTGFIYADSIAPSPVLSYSVSLSLEKINATDVTLMLEIDDHTFMAEDVTWPEARIDAFNADITRVFFRNNENNTFTDLAISNVTASLEVIPEPSATVASMALVAGLTVLVLRRGRRN